MVKLLNEKLEILLNLKNFTKEIATISPKTEEEKIDALITERIKYFDKINVLNDEIILKSKEDNYFETEEIKTIRENIKALIQETIALDNEIRKNINTEIKNIKEKLNQPNENSKLFNIKI